MAPDWQIYSAVAVTTIAVGLGAWVTSKRKQGSGKVQQRPEKWALVGKVAKLIVYPIKSCQGIEVQEAVVTKLGLKLKDHEIKDRDFMVVDQNGRMQTMVTNPTMSFISLEPSSEKADHLIMRAPNMDPITFTFPDPKTSQEKLCRVKFDSKVKALDCGDEVGKWLSAFLQKEDIRLYYHHINESQRTFEPYMLKCPQFERSDMGTFHNETSYLMVAQESIDDLNTRLEKKSTWKNWRPTILIDKIAEPFAEVNWSFVRIGNKNAILKAAVPCYRCPIVTVDQEAGILPKDGEPLKTLRSMNKSDMFADRKLAELLNNRGIMGLRLGLYVSGEETLISEGDPVYVALL